jgi:hypothetical protein
VKFLDAEGGADGVVVFEKWRLVKGTRARKSSKNGCKVADIGMRCA